MNIFHTKLVLLLLVILASTFALYGAKVSEVKYYQRGISLFAIGFMFIALSVFLSFIEQTQELWINIVQIIGSTFLLAGVILLTWFRKKLGI